MSKLRGQAFLLKAGDGNSPEVYTTVAAQLTTSAKADGGPIEVTDKDGDRWRKLLEGGTLSLDISSRGLITNQDSFELLRTRALAGTINDYQLHFQNGKVLARRFQIRLLDADGDYREAQQYALQLVSADDTALVVADSVVPYVPTAHDYATGIYLSRGAIASADGKLLMGRLRFRVDGGAGTTRVIHNHTQTGQGEHRILLLPGGALQFFFAQQGGGNALNKITTATFAPGATWYDALWMANLAHATVKWLLYLASGTGDYAQVTSYNTSVELNQNMNLDQTSVAIGAFTSGNSTANCCLSDYLWHPALPVDISSLTVRERFRKNGAPVDMGPGGVIALDGVTAALCLRDGRTQTGNAGAFTENGTFVACSSSL